MISGRRKSSSKFKTRYGNYNSANVKHWHGAKKDSWFSHIAVEVPGEETSNEWCDPVSDEEYEKLN